MKAPRVCPKSSASASSGVRAAQLKRTNGLSARREPATMASARRSLPVPLSPEMSTVTSRGAARPASNASRCMASDANTMLRERESSQRSLSFSIARRVLSTERRTTASSSSISNGLRK